MKFKLLFFFSLFPTMPRHNYWRAAPHVRALCEKYGVKYNEKTLFRAFADVVRYDLNIECLYDYLLK